MTPRCSSLSAVHDSLDKEEYQKESSVQSQPVTTDGQRIDRLILETPLMTPKRAPEEILRVWIAPYIDTDGDLHAEHVIFTTVRRARWAPETLDITPIKENADRMITPLQGNAS